MIVTTTMPSPVGLLRLSAEGDRLTTLYMNDPVAEPGWIEGRTPVLDEAVRQLEEYFAGNRKTFDLPLAARGTEFQRRVWDALCEIPYGTTISYAELARRIGAPRAVRAVGASNGRNPISIIVPCHRVIGADGRLVGYGGGLSRKEVLLRHEGCLATLAL